MEDNERVVYSLNVEDIQYVASEKLGRVLTVKEVEIVEGKLGEAIPWHDIIESLIFYFIEQRHLMP
jgi:hypothetical protein